MPLPFQLRIRSNRRRDPEIITSNKYHESKKKKGTQTKSTCTKNKPNSSTKPISKKKNVDASKPMSWREKLKLKNPEEYKKRLEYQKLYSRAYRAEAANAHNMSKKRNMSEKEKEKVKELLERQKKLNKGSAQRMRNMRTKNKLKDSEEAKGKRQKKKPQTRQEKEKHEVQKKKWRDIKQAERDAMSEAEHKAWLAKRRAKYALDRKKELLRCEEAARLKELQKKIEKEQGELRKKELLLQQKEEELLKRRALLETAGEDVRSGGAKRKSLQRARQAMPKKSSHYVTTALELVNKVSPKKAAIFKRIANSPDGPSNNEERLKDAVMKTVAEELAKPRKPKSLAASLSIELKRQKLQREASRKFNVSRRIVGKAKRLKAGRKPLSTETIKLVKEFYKVNSNTMPDVKLVSKKTGKATSFMDRSVVHMYKQFLKAHPHINISISKFAQLRPRNVKPMGKAKLIGCQCEYCANLQIKLKTINSYLAAEKKETISDVYNLSSNSMCNKMPGNKYHERRCLKRECDGCGVDKLHIDYLEQLNKIQDTDVTWKHWELVPREIVSKGKVSVINKRCLVTKTQKMADFIKELNKEMKPFPAHLFNKDWQNDQLQHLRRNMPDNTILSILDFAENYTCRYQNEAQGAYWTQESATVHPFVNYYKCQKCPQTMTESVVVISNDLTHDYHAVHAFQKAVVDHFQRKLSFNMMHRFSDCCGNQYRSQGPFSDISYAINDYNVPIQHNFSGERHGKGASDGESAVVKSHAFTAVKVGQAMIRNAEELYKYAQENLTREEPDDSNRCVHFLRTILYVPREDIIRDRSNRFKKRVDGTTQLHCIKTVKEGVVATRNLSCFCEACLKGHGACFNQKYVESWAEHKLYSSRDIAKDVPDEEQTVAAAPSGSTGSHPLESTSDYDQEDEEWMDTDELDEGTDEVTVAPAVDFLQSTSVEKPSWKCGDWVAVTYLDKEYPGVVTRICGTETEVDCMVNSGQFWKWPNGWPANKDLIWYSPENVLKKISKPIPVSNRGQMKFSDF